MFEMGIGLGQLVFNLKSVKSQCRNNRVSYNSRGESGQERFKNSGGGFVINCATCAMKVAYLVVIRAAEFGYLLAKGVRMK